MKINYKNLITTFLISILFSVVACKEKEKVILNGEMTLFSKFPKEINISFENVYEYKEGIPKTLKLVDSTLIIFNSTKNIKSYLYNYSLKTGKLSDGYLHKGRGPGEALGAASFGIIDDNLWIYDVTLKKILFIDKNKAIESKIETPTEYSIKDNYYQMLILDNNRFLANGNVNSKYKIQEMNFSEELLNEYGEFKKIPDYMPLDALKDAYHSFLYLSPSKEKLVVPYLYTDVIEIYNLKIPFKSIAVQGPIGIDIDFKVGKRKNYNYMEKNMGIRKTFLAGSVTENYIYLAFSGLSYAERDNINYCKFIYVYDWDGNPIKRINLDRHIKGLAVSKDDKTIYTYDPHNGFIIKAKI